MVHQPRPWALRQGTRHKAQGRDLALVAPLLALVSLVLALVAPVLALVSLVLALPPMPKPIHMSMTTGAAISMALAMCNTW